MGFRERVLGLAIHGLGFGPSVCGLRYRVQGLGVWGKGSGVKYPRFLVSGESYLVKHFCDCALVHHDSLRNQMKVRILSFIFLVSGFEICGKVLWSRVRIKDSGVKVTSFRCNCQV